MEPLCLDLEPDAQAPRLARARVKEWSSFLPEDARLDLVLGVSELVTNSVRHADGATWIRVRLTRQPSSVRVEVTDDGAGGGPTLREPHDGGGRGLRIVRAIASSWGASRDPNAVWMILPLR